MSINLASGLRDDDLTPWERHFLVRNKIGIHYIEQARYWFDTLLADIEQWFNRSNSTLIVGINGSQGSGKSTLADYLCCAAMAQQKIQAVALSLDDFYLTKSQRNVLSNNVHPLLGTRGVPGTHDINLALDTIDNLSAQSTSVKVPRFNKATDDRHIDSELETVSAPAKLLVLEGWCLGAQPQSDSALVAPINALERDHDSDGAWRHYVNRTLATDYQDLFSRVDRWVMLQAPSFHQVYTWRLEQEQKLIARFKENAQPLPDGIMRPTDLERFIQHYQRITECLLEDMPARVQHLFKLNKERLIVDYIKGSPPLP